MCSWDDRDKWLYAVGAHRHAMHIAMCNMGLLCTQLYCSNHSSLEGPREPSEDMHINYGCSALFALLPSYLTQEPYTLPLSFILKIYVFFSSSKLRQKNFFWRKNFLIKGTTGKLIFSLTNPTITFSPFFFFFQHFF